MIESLTRHIRSRWPDWNGGAAPTELSIALGSGGPAHRTRAACFVFSDRRRRPDLVLKIAFAADEAGFLAHEHAALAELRPSLPEGMRATIPEVVDLAVVEGNTVMIMRAVPGRRLLVPDLAGSGGIAARSLMRRFYRDSFDWSKTLAGVTAASEPRGPTALGEVVARFISTVAPEPPVSERLTSFRQAVETSDLRWSPCWQHQDVAVGNVLVDRRTMRFLDWEHAGDEAPPWFDITQSVGATARLAKRQSNASSSHVAAIRALGRSSWAGPILSEQLRGAWNFDLPAGWAVALTSIATALRQADDERMGADDWVEFVIALFGDDELRHELPWAVPQW